MVIFALFMTVLFAAVSLIPLNFFDAREPQPAIVPYKPSPKSQFGEEIQIVETGLQVTNFPGFDMVTNAFTLEGIVWFQFDPKNLSTASIGQFNVDSGVITEKVELESTIIGEQLRVKYRIRADFASNLDNHRFPLTDHKIYFVITNNLYSADEILFQSLDSTFVASDDAVPDSWTLVGKSVALGYNPVVKSDGKISAGAPRVIYSFSLQKPGFRQAMTLILPLLLLYLLGVFALTIRSEKDSQMALELSIGSIGGLVAYRFVVEQMSPKVGYLLISDLLHLMFFVAAFLIFVQCSYAHSVTTRRSLEEEEFQNETVLTSLDKVDIILFYGVQIAVLMSTVYITYFYLGE